MRQVGGGCHERAAQRKGWIVGQSRDQRRQPERRPPAAGGVGDGNRLGAVRRLRQGKLREHGQADEDVECPHQQGNETKEREQGADFLAEPDLVVRGQRRPALQGFRKPVEAVADRFMGHVFGRVGHCGRVQHAAGSPRDVTIDLAGFHRAGATEQRPQLRALCHVPGAIDAPHQRGEFLVLSEHQRHVARPGRRAVGGERLAGGRALQHHRLVIVGHRRRGGKDGPAAHGMAFEADIGLVDIRKAAQVGEAIRAAEPVGEGRRVAVAVAGLVQRHHHIAAPGEFDGEAVLGLAGIDIAVDREDAGRRLVRRGAGRDIEEGTHGAALGALEADILDANAA